MTAYESKFITDSYLYQDIHKKYEISSYSIFRSHEFM